MRYNKELFNLSKDGLTDLDVSSPSIDPVIVKKSNILLKKLLERFKTELNENENHNGFLNFKIKSEFFRKPESGYSEIHGLLGNPDFHRFMGEYGIYIGRYCEICNEWYVAYYQVIWDYQKYYEMVDNEMKSKKK